MIMRVKRKMLKLIATSIFVTLVLSTGATVYASPYVAGDYEDTIIEAEKVDDNVALKGATDYQSSKNLADPEKAAKYLIENAQTNVIKQVPTDEHDESLPEKFDLRDKGVVTPVKFQNPWGTCWGFSAIAASETSILSKLGKTYEETGLDLSEHHLTYFARTHLQDGSDQDGEGIYMINDENTFNTGGMMFTAASIFTSGIGPVTEAKVPYRGKSSETINQMLINYCYSGEDDWSLPSDIEFVQSYDLLESSILPSPAVYKNGFYAVNESDYDERESAYVGYDAQATDIWKNELMAGRAISVAFSADQFMPGAEASIKCPLYLNSEDNQWTHYTFDGRGANHAVTIVGWDDTIPSTAFLDHTNDEYGDGKAHQPEGDGAWIVKNSWGSEMSTFPNFSVWGIKDEEGKSTGYFYLSYYDRSLCAAETFDYDVSNDRDDVYLIEQYDYMQADDVQGWADENGLQMANVFVAEADAEINAVSCQTNSPEVSVVYTIYLLDDDAVTPDDGEQVGMIFDDFAYAGYHKTVLENPISVKKGQKYSIVVTGCFEAGNNIYYAFSTSTANNREYVEEYNRKIQYRNRNELDPAGYEDELIMYYSKGIVNEGESFVYMDALGEWGDFAKIVPYLQEEEQYNGMDFDNFPIKAYLSFSDTSDFKGMEKEFSAESLGFSDPAPWINVKFIVKVVGIVLAGSLLLALIVFAIIMLCKKIKARKAYIKSLEEKVRAIEEQNA